MNEIHFSEDTDFQLKSPQKFTSWLRRIAEEYQQEIEQLNYIYCSDNYLLEINQTYLAHDYFTDIITFDQREDLEDSIEGDIFISIDRVKDNAQEQNIPGKKSYIE